MQDVRRATLRVDAVFLTLAGAFGLVADVRSYATGAGPFGTTFYQNPLVIGAVEAHALAVLTAATLWFCSQKRGDTFGNWVALCAHLVLGGSNIVWFEVFSRVQAETQGVTVTVVHFVFVVLNAFLIVRSGANRVSQLTGHGHD